MKCIALVNHTEKKLSQLKIKAFKGFKTKN